MADAQVGNDKKAGTAVQKAATEKAATVDAAAQDKVEVVEEGGRQAEVIWNDSNMTTNFANVVNIQSTPEQLDICFGTNHTWSLTKDRSVRVELANRVIMSPLAAKRLLNALERVLKEHESRYGKFAVE